MIVDGQQLIHGDCLEAMKDFPDNYIDLTVTSPPYNIGMTVDNNKGVYKPQVKGHKFQQKYNNRDDNMAIESFYLLHSKIIKELLRVSNIIAYNFQIVAGSKEAFFRIIGDFRHYIKDIIIWDKGNAQPAMHERLLNVGYEIILILENDKKLGRVITNGYFDRGTLSNIWKINSKAETIKGHNAIMPLDLALKIIKNFSKEGDIILDCFGGAFTTGVACNQLNRKFIGIEKELEYFNIGVERMKANRNLFLEVK